MTNLSEVAKKIERLPPTQREAIIGLIEIVTEQQHKELLLQIEVLQKALESRSTVSDLRFAAICWVIGTLIALVAAALRFLP